jgi:hypothetical protein
MRRRMDDRNLRVAEAWLRLLAEAARGTIAAQETIRTFAEGTLGPQAVARRLASFLPAGVQPPGADAVKQWTESLFQAVGVVPRARHLELLERYEALRVRLEEAEVTIQRLKRLLADGGHEGEARKILDLFANAVGETLHSQTEWMRGWLGGPEAAAPVSRRRSPARRKSARRKRAPG